MAQPDQRDHRAILEPDREIVGRAQAVAARLKERASAVDRAREIPVETVRDLHEAGLLAMSIPRSSGGTEVNLVTLVALLEILGGACASTTWCILNHTASCHIIQRCLGEGASPYIRAVVEEGAGIGLGFIPAEATTQATAGGGFVSSGRWPFISFSHRCRWVLLFTRVQGAPAGWSPTGPVSTPPQGHTRCLVVRLGDPGVHIEDTWQAMSLRATMSNDVVLEKVLIPEERAPVFDPPRPGEPWVALAPAALRAAGVAAGRAVTGPIMLGIAQAALDETVAFAKTRTMSMGGGLRAGMPGNQFAVADATMLIESARALLFQEARAVTDKAESGEPLTPEDALRLSMAGLVGTQNAQKAVDRLFAIRGAHGLYETDGFERYYRDVRMGTLVSNQTPDLVREWIGKHLFGIPLDAQPRWG